MNKLLKLDNIGGLKAYQDVLAHMQNGAKESILYLCKAIGDNVIIDGCNVAGGNITAGIVVIQGRIQAFTGGQALARIKPLEIITPGAYKDGIDKDLYYEYNAVPHATEGVLLSSFVRIKTLRELAAFAPGNMPTETTDRYDENTSAKLATAKAVYELYRKVQVVQTLFGTTDYYGETFSNGDVLLRGSLGGDADPSRIISVSLIPAIATGGSGIGWGNADPIASSLPPRNPRLEYFHFGGNTGGADPGAINTFKVRDTHSSYRYLLIISTLKSL